MRIIALLWFSLFSFTSFSQDEGLLLSKYWNYRYALNGDRVDPSFGLWEPGFVSVGSEAGQSIPMRKRWRVQALDPGFPVNHPNNQWVGSPINNWSVASSLPFNRHPDDLYNPTFPFYIPAITDRQVHGVLHWSDAPTEIGKYIMLLSLELANLMKDADRYNLTSNNNHLAYLPNNNLFKQIMKTYYELNYAVSVFDRLDGVSDIPYGGSSGSGDGFIIRDDVPQNFADDGKFGRAQLIDPQYWSNTGTRYHRGNSFLNVQSQYQLWQINTPDISHIQSTTFPYSFFPHQQCGLAMSKDQLAKIMIGLVYARHFGKQFEMKYGNYLGPNGGISKKSYDAIDRTIWRLMVDLWVIYDPDGKAVCLGSEAQPYSLQFWEVYDRYASGDINPWGYAEAQSVGRLFLAGQQAFYAAAYPICLVNNTSLPGQAFSNEIYAYMCAMNNDAAMALIPNSLKKFGDNLAQHNDNELEYTLNYLWEPIRDRLYGNGFSMSIGTSGFSMSLPKWMPISEYESFMNRWNFQNCLHDTREYTGDPHGHHLDEKNGIDYMIAFNLYLLKKGHTNRIDVANNEEVGFIPMYDRVIEGTFPRSKTLPKLVTSSTFPPTQSLVNCTYTYGNIQTPAIIQAANSIDATNCHFEPHSRAILRAPHIELSPGFDARYGTVCDVQENQRMECTSYTQVVGPGNCPSIGLKMAESNPEVKIEKLKTVSLYPNPTENDATIRLVNYDKTMVNIRIYNTLGREMMQFSNIEITDDEQNYYMNLERLGTGIYIVKIDQGDYSTSLKLEKR